MTSQFPLNLFHYKPTRMASCALPNTNVTLGTVIGAFLDGASAQEVAYQFPSLDLADIYAVIAYYLRRRSDVDS